MLGGFEVIGDIRAIETIARGSGIACRRRLGKLYGRGYWRKMKGVATVRLDDGSIRLAELHWCEAHGIGRFDVNRKRYVR